jgi:hypothetical protein
MIVKNNHFDRFSVGSLERLNSELARVGRARAKIEPGQNGFITIRDDDGQWTGPAQTARDLLEKCHDEMGVGPDFWSQFPI